MIRCWSCGTEHESPASNDAHNRDIKAAYERGYLEGYKDAIILMDRESDI